MERPSKLDGHNSRGRFSLGVAAKKRPLRGFLIFLNSKLLKSCLQKIQQSKRLKKPSLIML